MWKQMNPFISPSEPLSTRCPCRESPAPRFAPSYRSVQHRTLLLLLFGVCLAFGSCGKKQTTAPIEKALKQEASKVSTSLLPDEKGGSTRTSQEALTLPTGFGKRTGDLDQMVKARTIRALVIVTPISFFIKQASLTESNTRHFKSWRNSLTRN